MIAEENPQRMMLLLHPNLRKERYESNTIRT
jgi:hypothetical protein